MELSQNRCRTRPGAGEDSLQALPLKKMTTQVSAAVDNGHDGYPSRLQAVQEPIAANDQLTYRLVAEFGHNPTQPRIAPQPVRRF